MGILLEGVVPLGCAAVLNLLLILLFRLAAGWMYSHMVGAVGSECVCGT